jgi:hypothetical protein
MPKEIDFFLYNNGRYHGQVKPENLVFNANLQEFAQKIGYICSLETSGKIAPEDSYKQIKMLWKDLKRTKKQLGIGETPPPGENDGNISDL